MLFSRNSFINTINTFARLVRTSLYLFGQQTRVGVFGFSRGTQSLNKNASIVVKSVEI